MAREASAERNTKETEIKFMDFLTSVSESMVIFRWMTIIPSRIQELFWELR